MSPAGSPQTSFCFRQASAKRAEALPASARQMAQPLVDPLRLDELAENPDVLVLLANAVGNPLTLLVAILPKVSRRCKVAAAQALATPVSYTHLTLPTKA